MVVQVQGQVVAVQAAMVAQAAMVVMDKAMQADQILLETHLTI
jgi:hypothetical protein